MECSPRYRGKSISSLLFLRHRCRGHKEITHLREVQVMASLWSGPCSVSLLLPRETKSSDIGAPTLWPCWLGLLPINWGQVAWLPGNEAFRDPVSSMGVILTSPTPRAVLNETSREIFLWRVGRFLSPEDAKS